jgi:uncharacterized membrane protein
MTGPLAVTLRALMLLALIVWIGGIIFFAFVMAPTLFSVLPSPQMAGNVVSPALGKLHAIGLISGIVFLLCSLLYDRIRYARMRLFTATNFLVVLMLALTTYSEYSIAPRMRELRASNMNTLSVRTEFDRLHGWSTRVEGGVLFLGLGLVVLTARRLGTSN